MGLRDASASKNCPFVNSCQHICRDICTGSLWQGWTFWPFWPNDQADTSWFPGRESKLPRVRYFGIFLDVIGLTFINWGFYWGDRCGSLGGHWSSIKDDADASPFQWWSRPQSMATPSTIFNGDFGLLPIECWTGITGRLKCVRWYLGYINSSQDDIMDTPPRYSQLGECHWLYSGVKTPLAVEQHYIFTILR